MYLDSLWRSLKRIAGQATYEDEQVASDGGGKMMDCDPKSIIDYTSYNITTVLNIAERLLPPPLVVKFVEIGDDKILTIKIDAGIDVLMIEYEDHSYEYSYHICDEDAYAIAKAHITQFMNELSAEADAHKARLDEEDKRIDDSIERDRRKQISKLQEALAKSPPLDTNSTEGNA